MNENIGLKIKELRKEKNLTQSQLAKLMNKSAITIRKWESGERTPSIDTIKQIANILEVPTFMLTGDNDVMNWFAYCGYLDDNSKVEKLRNKLNVTKLTSDNINSIRYNLEKDKIDLAIALLEDRGYKVTIRENEIITINDYSNPSKPFDVDMDTFADFSKNLHWAIDSFINKFIDENNTSDVLRNEESIMYDIGNGEFIPAEYLSDYFKNQLNKPRKLNDVEKKLIDKFGVGKGMHNRKKPDLKQTDK
ncbi:helix-turn-helix domain-containing protein [Romboutsia ilealis]|uniref:helix-turn-helix domain-containing protein n=1 Tax=Romboutsia ilealis TaxID=1115758 RepID=UPI002574385C|nr:helix-turn-helix transcriptional regulator [Romboutsia ilealis]